MKVSMKTGRFYRTKVKKKKKKLALNSEYEALKNMRVSILQLQSRHHGPPFPEAWCIDFTF
jgi:hypothetical protein